MQQTDTKKYKTSHKWGGKIIHGELYKRLKFDHTDKWNMHKPASVLENEILNKLKFNILYNSLWITFPTS